MNVKLSKSDLQLASYFLKKVNFAVNDDFDPKKEIVQTNDNFSVTSVLQSRQDTGIYDMKLTVQLTIRPGTNIPYSFVCEVVGTFHYTPKPTEDKIQKAASVYSEGSRILYGIAREHLRALTSLSPFPPTLIPWLSFSMEQDNAPAPTPVG